MDETLTLMRLGVTGRLAKSLSSTNPIESMIEIVPHTQPNVKRWQDGDMRKRWTAAGMLQAEQQFRRVVGYTDLPTLITAIERRHLTLESPNPAPRTKEVTATHDIAQLVREELLDPIGEPRVGVRAARSASASLRSPPRGLAPRHAGATQILLLIQPGCDCARHRSPFEI